MNVVFDLGAVLFTWRPVEIVSEAFPTHAATPGQARQLAHAMFGHADWQDYDRGLLEMDTVVDRLASRLELDRHALETLVQEIGDSLLPMEETIAVLQSLRAKRRVGAGVRGLYFLSNMPRPYARELEQKHTFLQHFDGGIFSGDVLMSKPQPDIYQLLQSRYQLEPAQTVFIDDLQGNVDAAKALGWKGIQFQSAAQLADELRLQCGL
jgi:putative hydrolase of the HAD superfamily